MLGELPPATATLWTDGSAAAGTFNGGSGGVLFFNNTTTKFNEAAGRFCSSYIAEATALLAGLKVVKNNDVTNCTLRVCTDSLSLLSSLKSGPTKLSSSTTPIWSEIQALHDANITIQLVHVPAHVGIAGNEAADREAAAGAAKQQQHIPIDFRAAKSTIKHWASNTAAEERKRSSITASGTRYYTHCRPFATHNFNRRLQTEIRRLRTGHSMLLGTYRHRINSNISASCSNCGHPNDTLEHFLIQCPQLQQLRDKFLDTDTTLGNALNKQSLAWFIAESGRLST